jgi:aryl-alcohol dehydrogenase-like predicted oxidoreductase
MRYTHVGSSGLVVSRLVLGMMSFGDTTRRAWHLDLDGARPLVRRAVEAGVTAFDTADVYDRGASEEVTGQLLRELFSRREDYVLATKVYYPMSDAPGDRGLSRHHILASIDASLERLGTDHVDLYLVHRWDYETPIEETMEALDTVVRSGKARYLGASSMYAWQFAKAQHVAERNGWHRFVAMQNHYHLAYREEEREMVPLCLDQGVGVMPYSPLARGLLAGTRTRGSGEPPLGRVTTRLRASCTPTGTSTSSTPSSRSPPVSGGLPPRSRSRGFATGPASRPRSSASPRRSTSRTPCPRSTST